MSKYTRTLLALIGATVLLSALTSAASANRLSITNQNIRSTWTNMEFLEPLGQRVICSVTLEGSMHSATISKVAGALIGYITRGTLTNPCVGGNATILQATLPWHVRYLSFEGVLPNITRFVVNVIGSQFRVRGNFGTCLFTSTTTQPTVGTFPVGAGGLLRESNVSGTITSGEACGPFGERITGQLIGNAGTITLLGNTTTISIRLI
jgi:hypothetical protein